MRQRHFDCFHAIGDHTSWDSFLPLDDPPQATIIDNSIGQRLLVPNVVVDGQEKKQVGLVCSVVVQICSFFCFALPTAGEYPHNPSDRQYACLYAATTNTHRERAIPPIHRRHTIAFFPRGLFLYVSTKL